MKDNKVKIPTFRVPIKTSTQSHLDIVDVVDNMLLLKGGRVSIIIKTSAVNFDLLSNDEQEAKMANFGSLLNSLTFPLQIVVRTKKVNVGDYLHYLENYLASKPVSSNLKVYSEIYIKYIGNLITKNEILKKDFYIVVSYGSLVLPSVNPFKKKKQEEQREIPKELVIEHAKINLIPRRDHILRQLNNMGLVGRQLKNNELIKLIYSFYNPI